MKRDLDFCRQLLADIEGHGPDCAVTSLRPSATGEAEETLRYHLRLMVDAGLVKEVDQTSGGVPCVRLTNAGHEMIELAHSEARWREAKWLVAERTGTQSLTVIRSVLARWAHEAAARGERWRHDYLPRPYAHAYSRRPYATRVEPRAESRYRFEREIEPTVVEEPRVAATRRPYTYLERFDWCAPIDWRESADRDLYYRGAAYRDALYRETLHREPLYASSLHRDALHRDFEAYDLDGVTLPTHVV